MQVHVADLQTTYSNQGLDVVEMRAIWAVMPAGTHSASYTRFCIALTQLAAVNRLFILFSIEVVVDVPRCASTHATHARPSAPSEFDLDQDGKKAQWRLFFCQKLQVTCSFHG
jgi:hypothetical protein